VKGGDLLQIYPAGGAGNFQTHRRLARIGRGAECASHEEDFLGLSYGFRPGRGQHDALDALWVGIDSTKVSWVVDADIQGFFDAVDHAWLIRFVERRIGDRRVIRLIRKWLKAGVSDEGQVAATEGGTPQGAVISPLLANIYLHYVFDLWAHQWRRRHARGQVILVRFADDLVAGFEHKADAERFLADMKERTARFALMVHRQDASHRVRPLRCGEPKAARRGQPGDIRLPRIQCAAETWKGVLHERLKIMS